MKIDVDPKVASFTIPLGATIDMGRTAINVTGDAAVTTCMARLAGMLDRDVFNNSDYAAVSERDLMMPEEPAGYDDFTSHGDPIEIGEQGEPDKFADIEDPKA